jgi:hypothetical protein
VSRTILWTCWVLSLCGLCLGCSTPAQPGGTPTTRAAAPVAPGPTAPPVTGGWHLTVYYTPVESYHPSARRAISDCAGEYLGQHSLDFLERVQIEGFGRMIAPVHGDGYLGWSFDRQCWFRASTPVGSGDRPLQAWVSTAASPTVPAGTRVQVISCGGDIQAGACTRVKRAAWTVDDRCSVGCQDSRHLDLYIGEEDQPDFESASPNYFDSQGAVVKLSG